MQAAPERSVRKKVCSQACPGRPGSVQRWVQRPGGPFQRSEHETVWPCVKLSLQWPFGGHPGLPAGVPSALGRCECLIYMPPTSGTRPSFSMNRPSPMFEAPGPGALSLERSKQVGKHSQRQPTFRSFSSLHTQEDRDHTLWNESRRVDRRSCRAPCPTPLPAARVPGPWAPSSGPLSAFGRYGQSGLS